MYEVRTIQQDRPSTRVRWFTSAQCDLYIWKNSFNDRIVQFQFCFNKLEDERVVEWNGENGLFFARIDDGMRCAGYSASPIMVPCDPFDLNKPLHILKHESGEQAERDILFVQECLQKLMD